MAIITTPITLPMADKVGDITTLIFDNRLQKTIENSMMQRDLVESTNQGFQPNGKGFLQTFQIDLLSMYTNNGNVADAALNSPFGNYPAKNAQEGLTVDTYEYTALSQYDADTFNNEAFDNASSVNAFLQWNYSLLQTTMDNDMYNKIRDLVMTDNTNKSTLQGIDFTDNTAQGRLQNALNISEWIYNRAVVYQEENTTLTEVTGVKTKLPTSELVLFMDSALHQYFNIATTQAFHSAPIEQIFNVAKVVQIPNKTGSIDKTKPLMKLVHKNKYAHLKGYTGAGAIYNPKTRTTNTFLHRATGRGIFKTHAGEDIFIA